MTTSQALIAESRLALEASRRRARQSRALLRGQPVSRVVALAAERPSRV